MGFFLFILEDSFRRNLKDKKIVDLSSLLENLDSVNLVEFDDSSR